MSNDESSRGRILETTETATPLFDGTYYTFGNLVDFPNPDMSVREALVTRRTVRAYRDERVPFLEFEKLIELAMHAPTACNEQLWKVLYVEDKEVLNELYLRGSAAFLRNAGQAFILMYDNRIDNQEYRDDIQSGAAFIGAFGLIAHSFGIGSCWVCHLPNKSELKRMFNIPRRYEPIALTTFGYYRKRVKVVPRKHSVENVIVNIGSQLRSTARPGKKNVPLRRIFRWLYYKIPALFRKKIRKSTIRYEKKFYFEKYD